MNSKAKAEATGGALDTVKLGVSLLILLAGVVGFYYYGAQPTWMRVLGLLVVAGIGVAVGAQSHQGKLLLGFLRNSNIELRKVVWPTRQETAQTTLMVLIVVVLVAIMLWVVDTFFGWAIRALIGTGG